MISHLSPPVDCAVAELVEVQEPGLYKGAVGAGTALRHAPRHEGLGTLRLIGGKPY